jgi:hypothetical protein
VKGSDLMGAGVSSPLTKYPIIYCLPMFNILMDKVCVLLLDCLCELGFNTS